MADREVPDPMSPAARTPLLQAPWRQEYLETFAQAPEPEAGSGSFLRDAWLAPERDGPNHVVLRTPDEPAGCGGLILLNAYPYAGGHLLVALGEACPRLLDYRSDQRAALWRLVDEASDLMDRTLRPQGINLGVNQGKAAGAGIPQHLHVHLVPRWNGDTNFMTVVGRVRVIPSSLAAMAERYRAAAGTRAAGTGPAPPGVPGAPAGERTGHGGKRYD
ncbi:MAG TPA: HIT domain-containing protein [Phycisphaerales bacterium]|nr:HIT domain-containing protein [Phycisphaerales bacterium]